MSCTLVLLFCAVRSASRWDRAPPRRGPGPTRSQGQVSTRADSSAFRVVATLGPGIDGVDATGKRVSTGVPFHYLFDGTTRHGGQALTEPLRSQPTSYFHRTGPLGEVFETLAATSRLDQVAVVGLGAGTIAAYGRPGRSITFYEIVPEVAQIARDERFFTYLRDSQGACSVEIADGREGLGRAADGQYGLIVVDAFSSDAVPIRLMTRGRSRSTSGCARRTARGARDEPAPRPRARLPRDRRGPLSTGPLQVRRGGLDAGAGAGKGPLALDRPREELGGAGSAGGGSRLAPGPGARRRRRGSPLPLDGRLLERPARAPRLVRAHGAAGATRWSRIL